MQSCIAIGGCRGEDVISHSHTLTERCTPLIGPEHCSFADSAPFRVQRPKPSARPRQSRSEKHARFKNRRFGPARLFSLCLRNLLGLHFMRGCPPFLLLAVPNTMICSGYLQELKRSSRKSPEAVSDFLEAGGVFHMRPNQCLWRAV